MHMLFWSVRHRRAAELGGQLLRIIGAAILTALGYVPVGNTGGVNVSPWRQMTVPADLAALIAAAMAPHNQYA
jgi:peptidoglycan/LPS O-acetylase OafA/YrhL